MADKNLKAQIDALEKRVAALEAAGAPVPLSEMAEDHRCFRYHKTEAPDGREFLESEAKKLGKDWKDTPAEWRQ